MKAIAALGGGLAGAVTLTLIHETVRKFDPKAPRMDLLGKQALTKLIKSMGKQPPAEDKLFGITMAGDIISNALYYSVAGLGSKKDILFNGAKLGLVAGLGAVFLPKHIGLNNAPSNRTLKTEIFTVAYYLIGSLVASAVIKKLDKKTKKHSKFIEATAPLK